MASMRYEGSSEKVAVSGYGHFRPGEEKQIDDLTAELFTDQRCIDEGWVVTPDAPPPEADTEAARQRREEYQEKIRRRQEALTDQREPSTSSREM
jgi:hypothetical protein